MLKRFNGLVILAIAVSLGLGLSSYWLVSSYWSVGAALKLAESF